MTTITNVTTTERSPVARHLTTLTVAVALIVLGWLTAGTLMTALAHPLGVVATWVVLLGVLVAIPFAFQAGVTAALSVID